MSFEYERYSGAWTRSSLTRESVVDLAMSAWTAAGFDQPHREEDGFVSATALVCVHTPPTLVVVTCWSLAGSPDRRDFLDLIGLEIGAPFPLEVSENVRAYSTARVREYVGDSFLARHLAQREGEPT